MKSVFGPNWLTTLGGILAGLPTIVMGSGLPLTPTWQHIMSIVGGLGVLLLGVAAKSATTHSTEAQVQASTVATAISDEKKEH